MVKKVKNTLPWAYVITDLNGEEIVENFYEKELQKTNQTAILQPCYDVLIIFFLPSRFRHIL